VSKDSRLVSEFLTN